MTEFYDKDAEFVEPLHVDKSKIEQLGMHYLSEAETRALDFKPSFEIVNVAEYDCFALPVKGETYLALPGELDDHCSSNIEGISIGRAVTDHININLTGKKYLIHACRTCASAAVVETFSYEALAIFSFIYEPSAVIVYSPGASFQWAFHRDMEVTLCWRRSEGQPSPFHLGDKDVAFWNEFFTNNYWTFAPLGQTRKDVLDEYFMSRLPGIRPPPMPEA